MDVLLSKILATITLTGATILAGIAPLKFRQSLSSSEKHRRDDGHSHGPHNRWLNSILSFSGGVLFSTIFIHLMPDVDEEFHKILRPAGEGILTKNAELISNSTQLSVSSNVMDKMPWGQLAICAGFFIIYALEEIVEYFVCLSCEKQHHHHKDSQSVEYNSTQQSEFPPLSDQTLVTESPNIIIHQSPNLKNTVSCWSPIHGTHGAHREQHQLRDCVEVRRSLFPANNTSVEDIDVEANEKTPLFKFNKNTRPYNKSNPDFLSQEVLSDKSICASNLSVAQSSTPKIVEDDHSHHNHPHQLSHSFEHDHEHDEHHKYDDVRNNMRGIMLIVALSFHSVFEGMAIGLQSTFSGILSSFIAVSMHKLIMAFCAGVELLVLGSKRSVFICSMVAFALICPIGISIGTIITEVDGTGNSQETNPSLGIASLQGLACGTLLYVTFFEVLTRTKGNEMASLINFISVLLGFVVITALHLVE